MEKKNKVSDWFSDRNLLIICILMSGLIWIMTEMTKEYTTEVSIPLEYIQSDSMTYEEKPPSEVILELRGPGWDLFQIGNKNPLMEDTFRFTLDQSSRITISQTDIVNKMDYDFKNLDLVNVYPQNILISQTKAYTRKIPIEPSLNIKLEKGYTLTNKVILKPDSVVLKGPQNEISGINSWKTDSLTTPLLNDSITLVVSLENPKSGLISLSTHKIQAILNVEQYTEQSVYVPIEVINKGDLKLELFPARIQIRFKIPISKYDEIDEYDFRIVADYNNRIPNTNQIILEIRNRPVDMLDINYNPKTVEYFIQTDE